MEGGGGQYRAAVATEIVVSDSSVLIALEQIRHLGLLQQLFSIVHLPASVLRETAPSVPRRAWMIERPLKGRRTQPVRRSRLDAGEAEAISLALTMSANRILLDDLSARHHAEQLGPRVTGTLGLLLMSKRAGYISALRPLADELMRLGFFVSDRLYRNVLADANES